jgi:molybdopterin/thiamine biosynthesis adenylyltransferase
VPAPKWEERWPGRLEYELQALRAAGVSYERDEEAWEHGILKLGLTLDLNGRRVSATATFPAYYPDFRVRVDAEPLGVGHHQNPLSGNLCLLGRSGDVWQPKSMNLAYLLGEQLERLLTTEEEGRDFVTPDWEDPQAEPYSAYYPYFPNGAVLVDGGWEISRSVDHGKLICGFLPPGDVTSVTLKDDTSFPLIRCAVLKVYNPAGQVIAEADAALREIYTSTFEARWIRRNSPLQSEDPKPAFTDAKRILRPQLLTAWKGITVEGGVAKLLGILFPEETGHRLTGEGWVFAVLHERKLKQKNRGRSRKASTGVTTSRFAFCRAIYAGREDLALRIPSLRPLRTKTIAAFGLGTLGAPAALEFARAGVGELRILDGDFIDAGPTVRWPFGLSMVGAQKTQLLHSVLREHYPYTRVKSYSLAIGGAIPSDASEDDVMNQMLDGASLIFDASAEMDLQRLLARTAREREIPYVSVVGKPGGWGGVVFRHLPGVTRGCDQCLLWSLQDGGPIPNPPADDDESAVQGRGCGDVTFTGTSFDMTTLALDGVRKAIGTLTAGEGGYPDGDWDVAVIALRNSDGSPRPPSWEVFTLDRDPRCGCEEA